MIHQNNMLGRCKSGFSHSLLVCLSVLHSPLCQAQVDGSLALDFGNSGIVTSSVGVGSDWAFALAVQDDDKIVVGGRVGISLSSTLTDFGVVRYNSDGTLDPGFGVNGVVVSSVSTSVQRLSAVGVQPNDGKILVAGSALVSNFYNTVILRYLPNGVPDDAFGSNGVVIHRFGQLHEQITSMALQQDGKILVGGHRHGVSLWRMMINRFNSNGTVDTDFGSNGQVLLDPVYPQESVEYLIVQPDQKILCAGYVKSYNSQGYFALYRFLENGQLDTDFGNGGGILTSIGPSLDLAIGMALHQNGKIVLCGTTRQGSNTDLAVVRYTNSGIPDSSFGNNGIVTFDGGGGDDDAWDVVVQPDERIILTGSLTSGSTKQHVVIRLDANGALDPTFGEDENGVVLTTNPLGASAAYAMVLQPGGYLLTAGGAFNGTVGDFLVTKHHLSLGVAVNDAHHSNEGPWIYPNPNNGRFTVARTEGMEPIQAKVFNALGQQVAAFNLNIGNPYVDIEQLTSGAYVLHWHSDEHRGSQRIIVAQ